jgi:hypothetical protein
VVDAWQHAGGSVVGLTVSQAAADVLATEAQVRAENTTKWLHETRHGRWQLPNQPLLLIDEASMVSTADLVTLVAQARCAGGKVLLVGDPAQLSAIHIGGAFDLLTERHGAAQLTEIRRFTHPWEADASVKLRDRDPAAIDAYAMRGRIHAGRLDELETALFEAWRADALGTDHLGQRETVAMIVATNDQAAVLGERARHALIAAGHVQHAPTVTLADNDASVGDHIVTRRNDRRLTSTDGHWVVNGHTWTITALDADGGAKVVRHGDGAKLHLPADYLANHTHLAYATTAHRAQGMTVDRAHATVDTDTTHQQLYVAATRGRHANELWVALDTDRDTITDDTHLPHPHQLLARALARRVPDRLSAHQLADDARHELHGLARLGAIFEDAARHATNRWLTTTLERHGLAHATRDGEWPSLLDRTRQLALQGHDLDQLLDRAVTMRPIDDAHSIAGVLHWRLGQLAQQFEPARRAGPLRSLPPVDGADDDLALARAAGELIRHRWHQLRTQLAGHDGPLPVARELGPRPDDPAGARSWLTAATAVVAYRERYELPDHAQLLGERPGPLRADAQAAYDHAQLQVDRHLARPYRHLDPQQLEQLRQELTAAVHDAVDLDPHQLHTAHTDAVASRRRWRTTTAVERIPAQRDHERNQLVVEALERTAHQRLQHDKTRQSRLDHGRRLNLPRQGNSRSSTPSRR